MFKSKIRFFNKDNIRFTTFKNCSILHKRVKVKDDVYVLEDLFQLEQVGFLQKRKPIRLVAKY